MGDLSIKTRPQCTASKRELLYRELLIVLVIGADFVLIPFFKNSERLESRPHPPAPSPKLGRRGARGKDLSQELRKMV
jgi:hypothetical protein